MRDRHFRHLFENHFVRGPPKTAEKKTRRKSHFRKRPKMGAERGPQKTENGRRSRLPALHTREAITRANNPARTHNRTLNPRTWRRKKKVARTENLSPCESLRKFDTEPTGTYSGKSNWKILRLARKGEKAKTLGAQRTRSTHTLTTVPGTGNRQLCAIAGFFPFNGPLSFSSERRPRAALRPLPRIKNTARAVRSHHSPLKFKKKNWFGPRTPAFKICVCDATFHAQRALILGVGGGYFEFFKSWGKNRRTKAKQHYKPPPPPMLSSKIKMKKGMKNRVKGQRRRKEN